MSNPFNDIFPLTKDTAHLEELSEKYPWCSVAQISLLQRYKKNNSIHFEDQAKRSALFFNNTAWLNWQLHVMSKENEPTESRPAEISEATVINESDTEKPSTSEGRIQQANTTETELEFEPLHTTDYFASQGIKLTDEPVSNDKLGTQMKSFTEWLKSMKKVHKEKLAEGDAQTDQNIQQIAENSNARAEVITEAMADVLIKQNKTEKAIEVYNKLSLINPSKSAYFAAKIKSLSGDGQI